MAKAATANDFLAKMNLSAESEPSDPSPEKVSKKAIRGEGGAKPAATIKTPGSSRQGLKHVGAYLDRETVEKVALLRARLDLDNSQLVRHAIERLYATESAKRKFGDA
jgi:hypothetical protein